MTEHEPVPTDEEVVVPDEEADAAIEPDVEFGDQEEAAQAEEWEEDAREGGV